MNQYLAAKIHSIRFVGLCIARLFIIKQRSLLLFCILTVTMATANTEEIGGDFSLTDHHNKSFELEQLKGKLVLLFFGYTYCPDICPTELANLAMVFDELKSQADQVQGLFISLDPERDTPEVLHDYVGYFSEGLLGLTGSEAEVRQVARQYRVKYQRHEKKGGGYSIDHSANLYVINREGILSAVVPYGMPPEHVLELVQGLLAEEG
ncbi:MAG: SCO family protein [Candidatus Thiodiazotropha sp. DIVDIV]